MRIVVELLITISNVVLDVKIQKSHLQEVLCGAWFQRHRESNGEYRLRLYTLQKNDAWITSQFPDSD